MTPYVCISGEGAIPPAGPGRPSPQARRRARHLVQGCKSVQTWEKRYPNIEYIAGAHRLGSRAAMLGFDIRALLLGQELSPHARDLDHAYVTDMKEAEQVCTQFRFGAVRAYLLDDACVVLAHQVRVEHGVERGQDDRALKDDRIPAGAAEVVSVSVGQLRVLATVTKWCIVE